MGVRPPDGVPSSRPAAKTLLRMVDELGALPLVGEAVLAQPPFLHCSLDVGSGGASNTVARPALKVSGVPLNGEQSVGARPDGAAFIASRPVPPLSVSVTVRMPNPNVWPLMLMTAVLPVTLRQVTGPPMLKVPNAINDPVPEGFSPEGPLDALMLMFVKIPPLPWLSRYRELR